MKLIVGLGNPGEKYGRNRHNVGYMAADRIFASWGFQPWRKRFSGELAEGRIGTEKCLLLKPATFMNLSGQSVAEAMHFYRMEAADLIVIHDEIDLDPGRIKVKVGGGNAGHNGLKSLSGHIGNDYLRVRIGVGRPADKAQVANYVLHDFAKAEEVWLEPLLDALGKTLPVLVNQGSAAFTREIAKLLAPEVEKSDMTPKPDKAPRGEAGEKTDMAKGKGRSARREDGSSPFVDKLKHLLKSNKDGE